MKRRDFLKATGVGVLTSGALLGSTLPAWADSPSTFPSSVLRTGPYLQDPAADAMTVMWLTAIPCYGTVEYGPTPQLGSVACADVDGLRQANNLIHRVRLTHLKPASKYYYRVVAKPITLFQPYKLIFGSPIVSDIHSFTTRDPAARAVKFIMYNDLHDNIDQWRKLMSYVAGESMDFAFLNGDVTDFLEDEPQLVNHFLDICAESFAAETPFLYARGNHETRGAFSRQLKQYLGMPQDSYHYAFTQGPARFVVLDSGEDKPDDHAEYSGLADFDTYRAAQTEFLRQEIRSEPWQTARFRIALWHIPGFYSDNLHTTLQMKNNWHPLLNEGKADLYLAGHTHRYTIAKASPGAGHNYPIVIGGGPKWTKGTVTIVEVDENHIAVRMIRDDGQTVGTLEV